MFTLRKEKLSKIKAYLSKMYCFVELSKSEGLTDDSVELEDFSLGLLNILYGCKFINLNRIHGNNFPAVDLGDEKSRRAFQISSDDSRAKISDSLEKFDNHSLWKQYDKPEFLILSLKKRKPNNFIKSTNFSFNPKLDILYIDDIYKEISKRDDLLDIIINYFEENLNSLVGDRLSFQTQEMIIFKMLFSEIAIVSKETPKITSSELNKIDESDLLFKKERFRDYWSLIEQNYAGMVDTSREKIYAIVEKSFGEDDLILMKEYLRLNSRKCLHESEMNPIKGIELLKEKVIFDLNLQFISETEIEYFLYYQLYYCFVFPN